MLCSIPASRSRLSWLDRLHTAKGFAVPSSDIDLDSYLHSVSNPNPISTSLNPGAVDPFPRHEKMNSQNRTGFEKDRCLFDMMSNAVSELFVMGDPPNSAESKGARKQIKPRAHVPSASDSADNSVAVARSDGRRMKRKRANAGKGAAGLDLSVCAGTVVTVIDTSSPGWKTEKHFRKGNVWKVRDEKVWNGSRKKRKLGLLGKLIDDKVKAESLRPLVELEGRVQNENVESQDEAYAGNINLQSSKEADYHIQFPKQPKFSRSPRLPVKSSSLLRLKVMSKNQRFGLL